MSHYQYHHWYRVAPHAGAWIETRFESFNAAVGDVAPHAGAWIETLCDCGKTYPGESHLTQVRGLKLD